MTKLKSKESPPGTKSHSGKVKNKENTDEVVHPLEVDSHVLPVVVAHELARDKPVGERRLQELLGLGGTGFGVEGRQLLEQVVALQKEEESLRFVSGVLLVIEGTSSALHVLYLHYIPITFIKSYSCL